MAAAKPLRSIAPRTLKKGILKRLPSLQIPCHRRDPRQAARSTCLLRRTEKTARAFPCGLIGRLPLHGSAMSAKYANRKLVASEAGNFQQKF
jgi:hypothetical protein